jgi:hypothetical protein
LNWRKHGYWQKLRFTFFSDSDKNLRKFRCASCKPKQNKGQAAKQLARSKQNTISKYFKTTFF